MSSSLSSHTHYNDLVIDDYFYKGDGTPLQWRETWRPVSYVLPRKAGESAQYLVLPAKLSEDERIRNARIAFFDGNAFYVVRKGEKKVIFAEYWIPFPYFLDRPISGHVGLNLQFPLEVLVATMARAINCLKRQNRILIKKLLHYKQKQNENSPTTEE